MRVVHDLLPACSRKRIEKNPAQHSLPVAIHGDDHRAAEGEDGITAPLDILLDKNRAGIPERSLPDPEDRASRHGRQVPVAVDFYRIGYAVMIGIVSGTVKIGREIRQDAHIIEISGPNSPLL